MAATKKALWCVIIVSATMALGIAVFYWSNNTSGEPSQLEQPASAGGDTETDGARPVEADRMTMPSANSRRIPAENSDALAETTPSDDVREYLELRADLEKSIKEYRSFWPVFQEFTRVLTEFVLPLQIEGERARVAIMEARDADLEKWIAEFHYNSELADRFIHQSIALELSELAEAAVKLRESEAIELPPEEARYLDLAVRQIREHADAARSNPHEVPYSEETWEHAELLRNQAFAALQYFGSIAKLAIKLPDDLEERRKALSESYERLLAEEGVDGASLPQPQVDPYIEVLQKLYAKSVQITELEKELDRLRSRPVDFSTVSDDD